MEEKVSHKFCVVDYLEAVSLSVWVDMNNSHLPVCLSLSVTVLTNHVAKADRSGLA